MRDRPPPKQESAVRARQVAAEAVAFLAADVDALAAFLTASGLSPAELRAGAAAPSVLAGALDFILSDEALARQFSQALALPPGALQAARAALPGGDEPHWT
ncbi:MAG: DUF3572 family protein [Paracoccaceae bacterium]